jgi:hypothetical protein
MSGRQSRALFHVVVVFAAVITAVALSAHSVSAADPLNPLPSCSVFDPSPCTPSFCGVFGSNPCVPSLLTPIGHELRVTVNSREFESATAPNHPIDTIMELYIAIRACWEPPTREQAHYDAQLTVRFSFNRNGKIIDRPRETYISKDINDDTRQIYRRAVAAALDRCTPMPVTERFGGAIAGRPISIRFVDDRGDDRGS